MANSVNCPEGKIPYTIGDGIGSEGFAYTECMTIEEKTEYEQWQFLAFSTYFITGAVVLGYAGYKIYLEATKPNFLGSTTFDSHEA